MTFFSFQIQDYVACAYGTNGTSAGVMHDSKNRHWFAIAEAIKISCTENQIIVLIEQCLHSTSFRFALAIKSFFYLC